MLKQLMSLKTEQRKKYTHVLDCYCAVCIYAKIKSRFST